MTLGVDEIYPSESEATALQWQIKFGEQLALAKEEGIQEAINPSPIRLRIRRRRIGPYRSSSVSKQATYVRRRYGAREKGHFEIGSKDHSKYPDLKWLLVRYVPSQAELEHLRAMSEKADA